MGIGRSSGTHMKAPGLLIVLGSLLVLPLQLCGAAQLRPTELRCEYLQDPRGIDTPRPRLSWVLEPIKPSIQGQSQSAYQILVASTPDSLARDQGDLWDSGRVRSEESVLVIYAGKRTGFRAALFLESARLGSRREAIGLERAGVLEHGFAGTVGLGGCEVDRPGRTRARVRAGRHELDLVSGRRSRRQRPRSARAISVARLICPSWRHSMRPGLRSPRTTNSWPTSTARRLEKGPPSKRSAISMCSRNCGPVGISSRSR